MTVQGVKSFVVLPVVGIVAMKMSVRPWQLQHGCRKGEDGDGGGGPTHSSGV
jgi:hypothetical protein